MSDNENEQHDKSTHESNHDNEPENEVNRNNEGEESQNPNNNENLPPPEEKSPFSYFEEIGNEIKDDSIFEEGKYKYSICILMKDDLIGGSQSLYYTLKGIEQNLKDLKEKLKINSEHIVIFIFVNCLYNEYLFKFNDLDKLNNLILNIVRNNLEFNNKNN